MSDPMSPAFIMSFLSTCFEHGLPEKAASELLQKESVDRVKRESAAFEEGYEKVASMFPGHLRVVLDLEEMEKSAGPKWNALMQMYRGAKGMGGGAFNMAVQGVRDMGSAASKAIGPRNPNSWLNKHPFPTFVGGTAAAGGLGALGYHMLSGDQYDIGAEDPFLAPGGYNPDEAKKNYERRKYDEYGPGIAQHNKDYYGTFERRKVLEDALKRGEGGSGARRELDALNSAHNSASGARERYFQGLDRNERANRAKLDKIRERQEGLRRDSSAWYMAPKRWFLKATGRDPGEYYKNRIASLEDGAAAATQGARLAEDRRRMLASGYSGKAPTQQPTTAQNQQNFFRTY